MNRTIRAAGHRIEIRGGTVLVDGLLRPLSPTGLVTLCTLARDPGLVVTRDTLLAMLPGHGRNTHAVDSAVLRLRAALGDKDIVSTVVKRGYRLTIDESEAIWT